MTVNPWMLISISGVTEGMDEEEMIRRITRMMEIGGTMLAEHHDCGAPLFRYKGEIVCPVCSVAGEAEHAAAVKPPEEKEDLRVSERRISESTSRIESASPDTGDSTLAAVRDSLHAKLRELCEGMAGEQDLSRLKSKLECIEIAIRVLRQL